jgi:hypothetical protein
MLAMDFGVGEDRSPMVLAVTRDIAPRKRAALRTTVKLNAHLLVYKAQIYKLANSNCKIRAQRHPQSLSR